MYFPKQPGVLKWNWWYFRKHPGWLVFGVLRPGESPQISRIISNCLPLFSRPHTTDFTPQMVVIVREMGPRKISGKSRLVKYYSIWPDGSFFQIPAQEMCFKGWIITTPRNGTFERMRNRWATKKKKRPYCPLYCLFNRDPELMVYYNPHITG